MNKWINKIYNKRFRICIKYGGIDFEFTIKHRTIIAGMISTLFLAIAFTFRILGNY